MAAIDVKETDYNRCMTESAEKDLSERELEILRLVATGVSNKEIAHRLAISPNTVKVHLRNIFGKIGVLSRTEAAMYAVRLGLAGNQNPVPAALTSDDALAVSQVIPDGTLDDDLVVKSIRRQRLRRWMALAMFVILALFGASIVLRLSNNNLNDGIITPAIPPETSSRWLSLPPPSTARSNLAVAAFENQLYAIGGETPNGLTGLVEVYDPASNTWEQRSPKPLPVADIQAAVIGGKFYIPGGRLADDSLSAQLDIYDPRTDRWEQGAALPKPLSAYALATLEGRLYVFGGWDGKDFQDKVYEYDPAQDAWFERTPMPTRRAWAGAAEAGNKIYVIGGYADQQALAVNEVYDPALDNNGSYPWETAEPLPAGRYGLSLASVSDILIILGGETAPGIEAQPLRYFPSLKSWQEFEKPYPESWSYGGIASLEAYIYIVGGRQSGRPISQLQAYQAVFTVVLPVVR